MMVFLGLLLSQANAENRDAQLGGGLTVVAQTPAVATSGVYRINAKASMETAAADIGAFCFVTMTNHGFTQDHLLRDRTIAGDFQQSSISESWPVAAGEAIQLVCYSGDSDSVLHNVSLSAVPVGAARKAAGSSVAALKHLKATN